MTVNLTVQIKQENSLEDKLPELKQEDTDNLNNPIQLKIKFILRNIPTEKTSDDFTGDFYQMLKKELKPNLQKLIPKIKRRSYFPTHFVRLGFIMPVPKLDKVITGKNNYRVISIMTINTKL